MVKRGLYLGIVLFAIILIGIFFFNKGFIKTTPETPENSESIQGSGTTEIINTEWMNTLLTDINTGNDFRIIDFSDKPILLESFAVWCPTCTVQQTKIKELHEEIGDSFISISLDTDPNEDADKVKAHTERNGFNWIYVISPPDLTRALIDEFGIGFVNAPSAPVALICPDGTSKKLRTGVKSSTELRTEIESCNI